MPATEQTWYNQKLLHIIFGLTGISLLVATIWMFASDYRREWKGYQRKFRNAEMRLMDWQIEDAKASTQSAEFQRLRDQLAQAQRTPPARALVEEFRAAMERDAERRDVSPEDFTTAEADLAELEAMCREADEAYEALAACDRALQQGTEALSAAKLVLDEADPSDKQVQKAAKSAYKEAKSACSGFQKASRKAEGEATDAMASVVESRHNFFGVLQAFLNEARGREDDLLSRRKFKSADVDEAKAKLGILVRDEATQAAMDAMQERIDEIESGPGGLDELTIRRQAATAHRKDLQELVAKMRSGEDAAAAQLAEAKGELVRLETMELERRVTFLADRYPGLGKRWLEMPILDAFNSPLKIDNLWTEGLTIPLGSFGEVRRFDRCTTCHRGIAKSAPGTADQPAFVPAMEIKLVLPTPEEEPAPADPEIGLTIEEVFGLRVAPDGLVKDGDVTVRAVEPMSPAALAVARGPDDHPAHAAGFRVGDVLMFVNDDQVLTTEQARQFLLDGVEWGEPVTITVQRGMPEPYTSHPRLDLFVGSLSPHKLSKFACTVCHEGQGSATAFKYASHSPNSVKQSEEWADKYGWFNNHHWIYPMFPSRFAESACLRCHHKVTELEPSERFEEAPAPKVVSGFKVIQDYGCFGCHEINGYNGPDQRIGPDLRLEPNYFAAAAAVTADPNFAMLDPFVQSLAKTLIEHPERDAVRHRLQKYLHDDSASDSPALTARAHRMADVLNDQETPGTMRRVGPSLRYVKSKLGAEFLNDWIRDPKHFRPSTKMPKFFGLLDHVEESDRETSEAFERVEIQAITAYLLNYSEPFEFLQVEEGVEAPSAERGKIAFEVRGCLACHMHDEFPEIESTQGPNLSGIGDKLSNEVGSPDPQAWLYSWLKSPNNYHARTKMPDLMLTPEENADGQRIDPAADITAYLLQDRRGWTPAVASNSRYDSEALNRLSMEYLDAAFARREAVLYLQQGIPAEKADSLKGAEIELVGSASEQNKLLYIGRKSIAKYGCFGCHDVPGFEGAKPIGAALADWGRKESSKLAFEHIAEYLHHGHGGGGHVGGDHGTSDHGTSDHEADGPEVAGNLEVADQPAGDGLRKLAANPLMSGPESAEDVAFFESQIRAHDRTGFIWQKLREPRSFDYHKTANKGYNERLRMPLFPFGAEEREAVMTFVLGLVAAPPVDEFVFTADPRRNAIIEGQRVLEKYNCAGCHVLRPEKWMVEFASGEVTAPTSPPNFPFLAPDVPEQVRLASETPDPNRGFFKAELHGMPAISNADATVETWDEDWEPIDPDDLEDYAPSERIYPIQLWQPSVVEGNAFQVGARVAVPASAIKDRIAAHGGDLARYLLTRVTELEKEANPNANGTESWSWVPPPLIGEGKKVQPSWLHSFLLHPYPIRPQVFLRMPKFNMSPDEASKLVNYFAAVDQVDYPYEFNPRWAPGHLADLEMDFKGTDGSRLDHAMKIVTDSNYCVKCHLVGDFVPEGNVRALAPDLAKVESRLRPEFMKRWIADPVQILPYTPMPVNVTYNANDPHLGGVAQELYPGTSIEQLDALVDLLTNYSEFLRQKAKIGELVKEASSNASAEAGQGR